MQRRQRNQPRSQVGLLIALAVLAVMVGSIFYFGGKARSSNNIIESDPLKRGEQLYTQNCLPCHGPNGSGQPGPGGIPALNSTGTVMRLTDGEIQRLVLDRGQQMPAYSGAIHTDDVANIIRYIHTWWSEEQLAEQQERSLADPLK